MSEGNTSTRAVQTEVMGTNLGSNNAFATSNGDGIDPNSPRVQIFDSWTSVAKVDSYWRDWQLNPNADIDFVKFIIGIRPECEHPYIASVEQDDEIEALLIGRTERSQVAIRIGYLTVARPRIHLLAFVHGGLLGQLSQASADKLVKVITNRIASGDADAAHFSHARQDSALAISLRRIPGLLSRDAYPSAQIHRSMRIPDNVESLYAGLSTKARKNQKWQAKKLLEAFAQTVEVRSYTRQQDLDILFRDADHIASTTYQRGLGVGFADTPEMRGRMELAATKGWLQAFVLYLEDKPAAFWVGTNYRNRFFSDCMGYDAIHSKYSPGMYLILKGIEYFCEQAGPNRITEIDFGLGDAQYKQVLGNDSWMEESIYIYSPRLRGMALNLSRTLSGVVDKGARAVLRKLGLEDRVKTGWRKRLASS
jgi:hypothetical protein